jgi:hypothetical protein
MLINAASRSYYEFSPIPLEKCQEHCWVQRLCYAILDGRLTDQIRHSLGDDQSHALANMFLAEVPSGEDAFAHRHRLVVGCPDSGSQRQLLVEYVGEAASEFLDHAFGLDA